MAEAKVRTTMEFFNMSDFLRGQSSKIITKLSEQAEVGIILKTASPWQY